MTNRLPEIKTLYNRLKASAKKRGIEFTLELTELYELGFPITCTCLGIKLEFNRGSYKDNSYSFDRRDNSIGYRIDNIVIVSYRANQLKSNATKEELKMLSDFYNQ